MQSIFISYRRADSADISGRIYDWFLQRIPKENLFKDVYAIEGGIDFVREIDRVVKQCKVMLVLIGPHWLGPDGPSQYTRLEVELGIKYKVRLIPILIPGAVMPSAEQLPESIRSLASLNALPVRLDPDFPGDMARVGKLIGVNSSLILPTGLRPLYPRLAVASLFFTIGVLGLFSWSLAQHSNMTFLQVFSLCLGVFILAGIIAVPIAAIQMIRGRHIVWGILLLLIIGGGYLLATMQWEPIDSLGLPSYFTHQTISELEGYWLAGASVVLGAALLLYSFLGQRRRTMFISVAAIFLLAVAVFLTYFANYLPNSTVYPLDVTLRANSTAHTLDLSATASTSGFAFVAPYGYYFYFKACQSTCTPLTAGATHSFFNEGFDFTYMTSITITGSPFDGRFSVTDMQGKTLSGGIATLDTQVDGKRDISLTISLPSGCYTFAILDIGTTTYGNDVARYYTRAGPAFIANEQMSSVCV